MSAEESSDLGVAPGRWNALVRRARIGRERKHAALTVSSYADKNGRGIKCGVARLAADCEIGYSTARRYLAWLRDTGLIELVRAGNHKKGLADEYRLILDEPKYAHLDIPEGDEYRKIVDEVNGGNAAAQKGRRMRNQRSPKESANATDHAEESALTMASADDRYQRSFDAPSALIHGEPPPSSNHLVSEVRPSTGGAPPPDPRRRPPPSASATSERKSPSDPLTPAQDQQRNSLPHATARGTPDPPQLATVTPIDTFRRPA
jgi:hypothetical protein